MIDYSKVQVGDVLRVTGVVTGAGLPGYAKVGDLVRVIEVVEKKGVWFVNRKGKIGGVFAFMGAVMVEPTEFKDLKGGSYD